ncbi:MULTISPECIES: GNAT family N-acetyltransferase [Streptomycetaceae]|uniref:GNAT family N-acetyltransferase n=1 Tax=unclassified Streptomyces TaxID=2593676 RepID=UPI00336C9997
MADQREVVIVPWPGPGPVAEAGPAGLLAAYHLATEAEKGTPADGVAELPERYRAEVLDPRAAFAGDVVLVASSGGTPVGCVVVTAPDEERSEIKRLWTDPAFRGRSVASRLIEAALTHCAESGVGGVRLSVWDWRTGAIALYERLGFAATEPWDERDRLVCMERAV